MKIKSEDVFDTPDNMKALHDHLYILPFNNDNQGVTTCKITMYI